MRCRATWCWVISGTETPLTNFFAWGLSGVTPWAEWPGCALVAVWTAPDPDEAAAVASTTEVVLAINSLDAVFIAPSRAAGAHVRPDAEAVGCQPSNLVTRRGRAVSPR